MSIFEQARNFVISGGQFTSITTKTEKGEKGINLLLKHIAPDAFYNPAGQYDAPKCHENTRVAVIQAIMDWIEDDQKTTFIKWMHGAAGAGKSAIAQEIAKRYHKSGRLAASFFWSRNAAGRNDETHLIPSLAYQLLIAIPQIRDYVEEAVKTDPCIFARSMETQMESLIIAPLTKVFGHGRGVPVNSELPNLIILDGLDECSTPQAQQCILKVIANAVRKFPIPLVFLIASRPEHAIRTSFHVNPLLDITVGLVLDERYNPDDDIRLFLVASFKSVTNTHELRSHLPDVWPTENNIDRLIHKSSGQFIYASTIVKFVSTSRRRPDKQLDIILGIAAAEKDTPFAELDALYHHIFSSVENWPRVFDILACLFLLRGRRIKPGGYIETILSYSPGELRLILIDLHSVMEVPGPENQFAEPRILHASLADFLINPSRSGNFCIDQAKAHTRIAQHFLRFIKHYSHTTNDKRVVYMVFFNLEYHCSLSSPTRELLHDFFDFDPLQWASRLINQYPDLRYYLGTYFKIIRLYHLFQGQEVNVQGYFGLECSLSMYHLRSWEIVLDLLYKAFSDRLSTNKDIIATAMTHPQILYHRNRARPRQLSKIFNCGPILDDCLLEVDNQGKEPVELQKYLYRAGRSFVHGETYAKLSANILDFILETCEQTKYRQVEDNHGTLEGSDIRLEIDDYYSVSFAINTLPFYLSNAHYTPGLARHASNLPNLTFRPLWNNSLYPEVKGLHQAIDLYIKKRPLTLEAENAWQSKRCRSNGEAPETTDLATPLPAVPQPPKRQKVMYAINSDTGLGSDICLYL